MEMRKMELEIELLRSRLADETEDYKKAVKNNEVAAVVKPLYLTAKNTIGELRIKLGKYEQLLNKDMEKFDRHYK